MNFRTFISCFCFALLHFALPVHASADEFTDSIHTYLKHRVDVDRKGVGMVVGILDEHGSKIISYGTMDKTGGKEVNGDTLFEIGSVTKTFTGLLLQDMIQRGEMKLDDPVARYLPKSARLPSRNGKEITLLHLVTHTSGLPHEPDNLDPKRADNPRADYTADKLYSFLSSFKLTRDPGAEFEYSSLGFGLLGHVITLKAGTNYEALVVDRICRPLKMNSTQITLTPELKVRMAQGYNESGYEVPGWDYLALAGCGALRSTANDQLKYISASLGLTPSSLASSMEKTHAVNFRRSTNSEVGLGWFIRNSQATKIIGHDGGTGGYASFIGFDKTRRRGVVVLSNLLEDVGKFGLLLLEKDWQKSIGPEKENSSDK